MTQIQCTKLVRNTEQTTLHTQLQRYIILGPYRWFDLSYLIPLFLLPFNFISFLKTVLFNCLFMTQIQCTKLVRNTEQTTLHSQLQRYIIFRTLSMF